MMAFSSEEMDAMTRSSLILLVIVLGSLALRLAFLPFVQFMGISDPSHYYNLALRLLHGDGFTLDYLWHFSLNTETLYTPFEFWQPLAGLLAAGSMWLFGEGVRQAILPFILLGSLLPLVSYFAAKQFSVSEQSALFLAVATSLLPEFFVNSLHTDTLIPNAVLLGTMMISLLKALQTGSWRFVILSGIFAGLAYLTRGDNLLLLPMFLVTVLSYLLWGRKEVLHTNWWRIFFIPLIAVVIISPWLWRNYTVLGHPLGVGNLTDLMFYNDFRDHYSYQREFSLDTLLAQQSISDLLLKRLIEGMSSLKMMVDSLGVLLPVGVIAGLLSLLHQRDKKRLLTIAPTVILLGGMAFAYVVLVPIANQGGSFKKSYLTLIPVLLPLAGYALDLVISNARHKIAIMILTCLLLAQAMAAATLADIRLNNNFLAFVQDTAAILETLPDTNGDGEIIVMTQDPFIMRFVGFRALQIPMEDRDTVIEVAERYQADYIFFPAGRPALDLIHNGQESDRRFVVVAIIKAGYALYRFDYSQEADQ
jgi:4-amino-4-deoxy-L-arabinose transferase-like glycosyltransferase